MAETPKLKNPWLIAVWPGMGQVAISAGFYLMAKLGVELFAEFTPQELFEVDHVRVEDGLIRAARLPRSRLCFWADPQGKRDLVLFIGEAQPPLGKYAFCKRLIDRVLPLGVERVFTFAAMGTTMDLDEESRLYAADTDPAGVEELKKQGFDILDEGHISGLNGVLLGVAAERGLRGTCLLGEMPAALPQLPFPKASLAVVEGFANIAGIRVDLEELREQARQFMQRLNELIDQVGEEADTSDGGGKDLPTETLHRLSEPGDADRARIEALFDQARQDRSHAYQLKAELDRLGLFGQYEDRFLDLFRREE